MTCSGVLIWFAERPQQPTPRRYVLAKLGNVRWQLESLHDLGLLNCHLNFKLQDVTYSLKNYASYQKSRAA